MKTRDLEKLPDSVDAFKKAKLPDDDKDLAKAEHILKVAMAKRCKCRFKLSITISMYDVAFL